MKVAAGYLSDKGQYREKNQDRFFYRAYHDQQHFFVIACVCDGIGSMEHSEIASEMVMQNLKEWYDWITKRKNHYDFENELVEELENTAREANESIYIWSKEKQMRIGCTMSTILVTDQKYYTFHVGDSRIGCLRGDFAVLTRDEVNVSVVDGMVKAKLANFMGKGMKLWLNQTSGTIAENDVFVVGSDGLFHKLSGTELAQLTEKVKNDCQMQKVAERLIADVRKAGERDNVSCIVFKIKK